MQGIGLDHYVSLMLVEGGIKPAAIITYWSPVAIEEKKVLNTLKMYKISREEQIEAEREFHQKAIKFHIFNRGMETEGGEYRGEIEESEREYISYAIAKEDKKLQALLRAETCEQRGIALGYPQEAARAFYTIINRERRDGIYKLKAFANARDAGAEIPLWLAYIQWIPEELDLMHKKISKSSEERGKQYMEYVRKRDPFLARRVEQAFISEIIRFPTAWIL